MKLAVTDANIFIDLFKLQMLPLLFQIKMEIYTTQEIIDQLSEDQIIAINEFIISNTLIVCKLSEEELEEVVNLEAPRALEIADKSVAWLSIKLEALVLSGDGPLRKFCQTKNLEVRGIIWLFDSFLETNLISLESAREKMTALLSINSRLPKELCEERIKSWSKQ